MFRLASDELLPIGIHGGSNQSVESPIPEPQPDLSSVFKETPESDAIELVHRILVVEDDDAIREYLESALAKQGHLIDVAKDGLEALAIVSRDVPDLIVSDIDMPRLSGIQLCETLKSDPKTKEIPVILLTGQHQSELIRQATALGVAHFLPKPIRFKTLLAFISASLEPN